MGEVRVDALRAVDLDGYEAEFFVLLGASGSGQITDIHTPQSDCRRRRGQALAIAAVALCGVATFVTLRGSYEAL